MTLPRRTVLDNGLVVIARPTRGSGSIAVRFACAAGAAFDPPGREGTASLAASLLDRGAGGLPAETIADGFDFLGARYTAATRRDTFEAEVRCLAPHLPVMLDRLRLVLAEPAFPEAEVRREQGQTLTTLAERAQDTGIVAEETLAATLYPPGHPYHHPRLGTRESIAAIRRDDLAAFHRSRFGPRGAVLALAGDFDATATVERAAAAFGNWKGGPDGARPAIPDPPGPGRAVVRVVPVEGKPQADVAFGFPGLPRRSPDLPAALVLNSILGEFGLGGRLGRTVREEAGLAYYAYSALLPGLCAGPLVVRSGVANERVSRVIALIMKTLRRMIDKGVTPAEMRDSRQALSASIPRRLETGPQAAAWFADIEFYGLGLDYPERLPALIRAVTRDQVQAMARRHLTLGRHVLVVAGPSLAKEALRAP